MVRNFILALPLGALAEHEGTMSVSMIRAHNQNGETEWGANRNRERENEVQDSATDSGVDVSFCGDLCRKWEKTPWARPQSSCKCQGDNYGPTSMLAQIGSRMEQSAFQYEQAIVKAAHKYFNMLMQIPGEHPEPTEPAVNQPAAGQSSTAEATGEQEASEPESSQPAVEETTQDASTPETSAAQDQEQTGDEPAKEDTSAAETQQPQEPAAESEVKTSEPNTAPHHETAPAAAHTVTEHPVHENQGTATTTQQPVHKHNQEKNTTANIKKEEPAEAGGKDLAEMESAASSSHKFYSEFSWFNWVLLVGVLAGAVVFDHKFLRKLGGRPATQTPTLKRVVSLVLFWIVSGLMFNLYIASIAGYDAAAQFFTGFLLEYLFSFDHLFVYAVLLTASYQVPAEDSPKLLFAFSAFSLFFRFAQFSLFQTVFLIPYSYYILGMVLIAMGVGKLLYGADVSTMTSGETDDMSQHPIVWAITSRLNISPVYSEGRFLLDEGTEGSRRLRPTKLSLVLVALVLTDLVLSVDTTAAKTALIPDVYISFSSTAWALFGIRTCFFILDALHRMFHFLRYVLSSVMVFVGMNMLLSTSGNAVAPQLCAAIALFTFLFALFVSIVLDTLGYMEPLIEMESGKLGNHITLSSEEENIETGNGQSRLREGAM